MALKIGSKAPAFNLPDKDGNNIALKDFLGGWVVLYFYPKDNTPGCTTESMEFTKAKRKFKNADAEILGASPDSQKSHCNFADKHKLGITLISDEEKKLAEKYGVWQLKKNYGKEYMGIVRSTFLIDPKGKLAFAWEKVKVKDHVNAVLDKLKQLAA